MGRLIVVENELQIRIVQVGWVFKPSERRSSSSCRRLICGVVRRCMRVNAARALRAWLCGRHRSRPTNFVPFRRNVYLHCVYTSSKIDEKIRRVKLHAVLLHPWRKFTKCKFVLKGGDGLMG